MILTTHSCLESQLYISMGQFKDIREHNVKHKKKTFQLLLPDCYRTSLSR